MRLSSIWVFGLVLLLGAGLHGRPISTSLSVADRLENGTIIPSRPSSVSFFVPTDTFPTTDRSPMLRIEMERVNRDSAGRNVTQILFSKKYLNAYLAALQRFFDVADRRSEGRTEQFEIAEIPSWDAPQGPRNLYFSYFSTSIGDLYLVIRSHSDWEYAGGPHYFSLADAKELQSLLLKFSYDFN